MVAADAHDPSSTRPAPAAPGRREEPSTSHAISSASGERLSEAAAAHFRSRYSHDFSAVRIHADRAAGRTARTLGAHAFTLGNDIHFAPGAYAPATSDGQRLLAHELAHVVQQATGSPLGDDQAEAEARAAETSTGAVHTGPGRPVPRVQRSPIRVIRTPETDEAVQRLLDERDPTTYLARLAEVESGARPVLTFPIRTTRFGSATLRATRSGEDIVVKVPVGVWADSDFRAETRTVPIETFTSGLRIPRWAVVKVVLYENPWWAPNITGSTGWDRTSTVHLPAEGLLRVSDAVDRATLINIGLTVFEALSLSPAGRAAHAALGQAVGRGARTALASAMIGTAEAAPTALAGVAGRASTVLAGSTTQAVERGVVAQATSQAVRSEAAVQASSAATREVASSAATQAASRTATAPAISAAATTFAAEAGISAARQQIAGATDLQVSQAQFVEIMSRPFPSHALHPVLNVLDGIGERAARVVVTDPRFIAAVTSGNMALAGTLFHSAAAREVRALPATALPLGWSVQAELTIQSGLGGSRADVLFRGPGNVLLEIDWKTTARSALSSGSRSEMERHAGQITAHLGQGLATQESRSWVDYVRPLLPWVRWQR